VTIQNTEISNSEMHLDKLVACLQSKTLNPQHCICRIWNCTGFTVIRITTNGTSYFSHQQTKFPECFGSHWSCPLAFQRLWSQISALKWPNLRFFKSLIKNAWIIQSHKSHPLLSHSFQLTIYNHHVIPSSVLWMLHSCRVLLDKLR